MSYMPVLVGMVVITVSLAVGIFVCTYWMHTYEQVRRHTADMQEQIRVNLLFDIITQPLKEEQ